MWNLTHSNRICQNYEKIRNHQLLTQQLHTIKSRIDNRPPIIPAHILSRKRHSTTPKFQRGIRIIKAIKIDHENQLLLNKILHIDSTKCSLSPNSIQSNQYVYPNYFVPNYKIRHINARKVSIENIEIAKRLTRIESNYNVNKLSNDFQKHEKISKLLSRYLKHPYFINDKTNEERLLSSAQKSTRLRTAQHPQSNDLIVTERYSSSNRIFRPQTSPNNGKDNEIMIL